MSGLTLHLSDEALEALADRLEPILRERLEARTQGASLREWLNVPEAAEYLGCGEQRIYQLRSDGRLPAHKEGGRAVVRRADLDALVDVDEVASSRRAA